MNSMSWLLLMSIPGISCSLSGMGYLQSILSINHSFQSLIRLPPGPRAASQEAGLTVVGIVIWLGFVQRPPPSSSLSGRFKVRLNPVQTYSGASVGTRDRDSTCAELPVLLGFVQRPSSAFKI